MTDYDPNLCVKEIPISTAYFKIRSWLQMHTIRFIHDPVTFSKNNGFHDKYSLRELRHLAKRAEESLLLIASLPMTSKACRAEQKALIIEAVCGKLEWTFWMFDGEHYLSEYSRAVHCREKWNFKLKTRDIDTLIQKNCAIFKHISPHIINQ